MSQYPAIALAVVAVRGAGAITLAASLLGASSTAALAAAAAPPAPAAAPAGQVGTLVVTATPSTAGDIKPDTQLAPEDVQALGVGSASEVLTELSSQTQSASGEAPVILLNGRLISGAQEINDIPAEAIRRIEILPEEASLAFGASGSQRVVNIVLQPAFRGKTVEVAGAVPTEGGRVTGQAGGAIFKLEGEDRLNIGVRYVENTALTEDERDLISRSTTPFATAGNVVGTGLGGEIDPALSALAGRPVTVAGLPAGGFAGRPALSAFNTAANPDDTGAFRTLLPASRQLNANVVVSKKLGDFSATLNGALGFNQSRSTRGLPSLILGIPVGNPFSPFSQAATLDRYATGLGPLRSQTDGWTGRLGANVRRDFGSFRTNLTASYDHADTLTVTDVGVDTAPLQALLNAGSTSFNPFGPLPGSLTLRPENKGRSLTDTIEVRALARTPLFKAPAGTVTSSFRVSDQASWINSRTQRLGTTTDTGLARNTLGGQATIAIPLTSRRNDFLAAIGDLSLNGNVGVDEVSDFGAQTSYGAGLNWTPISALQLRVSYSSDERAPSLGQLNNPTLVTPATRVFDYVTGQTVDVINISGGNRNLVAERREALRLSANFKPFSQINLNFTANYTANRNFNSVQSFPAITAEIQAAFPDRFVRDAAGNLLQFDSRPVNFAREDIKQLRYGFNFIHRLGAARGGGQGVRDQGARGQGGQFAPGQRNLAAAGAGAGAGAGAADQTRPGGGRPVAGAPGGAPGQRAGGARQGAGQGGGAQDFVALAALADADRNGQVTKQEWLAIRLPEALFTRVDANGDGAITRAEMAALPARAAAAQQGAAGELAAAGQDEAQAGPVAGGPAGPAGAVAGAAAPGLVIQGPPGQGGPQGGPEGGPPGGFEARLEGGPPPGGFDGPVIVGPGGGGFDGGGPRGGGFAGGGGFGGGGPGGGGPGGGGFGGGPGGGGGGGGRGGGGGGGNSLQLSVFHTVFFENKLLARPGVPVFDRLNGSAAGGAGGRPRHQVQVEAGYNRGPLGLRLTTSWQSATFVAGTGAGNLFFSDLTTTNLRLFANLGQMRSLVQSVPLLEQTRVTLLLTNLFNQRQTVRDANGATPLSYQPGFVDPQGRVVRLELRKQF